MLTWLMKDGRAWAMALVCTIAGTLFSYFVLSPRIGFDDANITLTYARNIAEGHGYVYNIGGERVEGSTSPLWTAIAALTYLLPGMPERLLAGFLFLIAWATVWLSMRNGEDAFRLVGAPVGAAGLIVGTGFLALPAFFGWMVWSLMDIGLWVLLIMVALRLVVAFSPGTDRPRQVGAFALVSALLAITRPEGIAVALGFALVIALFGLSAPKPVRQRNLRAAAAVALAGLAAFGVLILARLAYFGDTLPNTYYSKVSTDHAAQLLQGLTYLKEFLKSPVNTGLLLLAAALPLFAGPRDMLRSALGGVWIPTMLAVLGGIALYVAIGGDHFGSFRFFLFTYPALLPLAALTLWLAGNRSSWRPAIPILGGLALILAAAVNFAVHKGDYVHEFRIAEQGREIGRILNLDPDRPSIGVVAAGGVALTYQGHVYDLLGLNWVAMARVDRDRVGAVVNHGGFSKTVFYDTLPGIVHPQFGACDKDGYDSNRFFGKVLRGLLQDEKFQQLYRFECFEGLRFYRLAR